VSGNDCTISIILLHDFDDCPASSEVTTKLEV